MRQLLAVPSSGEELIPALKAAWDGEGPAVLPYPKDLEGQQFGQLFAVMQPTSTLKHGKAVHLPFGRGVNDDVVLVVQTSGSTGTPKGVQLTKQALEASVKAGLSRIEADPTIPWLCVLPLNYIAGILTVIRGFVSGTDTVIHDGFDVDRVISTLKETPHHIALVPTMAKRLIDAGYVPSGEGKVLIGGAAAGDKIKEQWPNATFTWGMAETAGGCVYDGKALDGVSVLSTPSSRMRVGGDTLMFGYREVCKNATDPTECPDYQRGNGLDSDGWFTTSDLGAVREGVVEIFGRSDDVINTGGEKVISVQIQRVLEELDDVKEAYVVGIADDEWGQKVVALLVPEDPQSAGLSERLGLDNVKEHVKSRLGTAASPKEVLLVRDLPRLDNGKVDRIGLTATVDAIINPATSQGGCGGGCCGGNCG